MTAICTSKDAGITMCFAVCRGVRERTAEDIADVAAFPFDEAAEMKSLGALGPHGEEDFTTLERRYFHHSTFSQTCVASSARFST